MPQEFRGAACWRMDGRWCGVHGRSVQKLPPDGDAASWPWGSGPPLPVEVSRGTALTSYPAIVIHIKEWRYK